VADELLSTFTAALRRFAMPDTTRDGDKEEKKLQEQRRLLSIELIGHITAALQRTVLLTQRQVLTLLPRKKLEGLAPVLFFCSHSVFHSTFFVQMLCQMETIKSRAVTTLAAFAVTLTAKRK
jgi:hypothetical protein